MIPSENVTHPKTFKKQDGKQRSNNWKWKQCMGNTSEN